MQKLLIGFTLLFSFCSIASDNNSCRANGFDFYDENKDLCVFHRDVENVDKTLNKCLVDGLIVDDLSVKKNAPKLYRHELNMVLEELSIASMDHGVNKDFERNIKLRWPNLFNICPEKTVSLNKLDMNRIALGALYSCTEVSEDTCEIFGLTLESAKTEIEKLCGGENTGLTKKNVDLPINCTYY